MAYFLVKKKINRKTKLFFVSWFCVLNSGCFADVNTGCLRGVDLHRSLSRSSESMPWMRLKNESKDKTREEEEFLYQL